MPNKSSVDSTQANGVLDTDHNCDDSIASSNSSPERFAPFVVRYDVYLGKNVTKNGNIVMMSVESIRREDNHKFQVFRQYEDFEYLHHCLTTAHKTDGLIIPPLPDRPAIEPELAHERSRKEMGADSKTLIGDQFNKDCWLLQYYLRCMLKHPVFGNNAVLDTFLTEKEAPPRPKLKKGSGFMSRLTDSFDNWKYSHKDCDEAFQKERDLTNACCLHMKEASDSFDSIISSRRKLCEVLSHLSAALNINLGDNEGLSRVGIRFCNLFSKGLDDYRHCLDVISHNDQTTLGNTLYYWHRYYESHREMLFKRTCLQLDYENANRMLDKAKPQKKSEAQDAKMAAERAFEECSEVALQEIKRFHRERIEAMALNTRKFAESQLIVAKDMVCVLHNSIESLKKFEV